MKRGDRVWIRQTPPDVDWAHLQGRIATVQAVGFDPIWVRLLVDGPEDPALRDLIFHGSATFCLLELVPPDPFCIPCGGFRGHKRGCPVARAARIA